ncbi:MULTISPECIES: FAD-dependent oxidoreductase [unclassified Pseudodesulfovibrio]|uniref:NAD(P)/FAD-dependent oxidoreductase n=1 Tax=unclassified Pseudodesulfovibrio TaxID=2661612 RepID=UPI000FEBE8B2|nr:MULTISPECIES: FAD-dependent oxidoreductase [unclassified Pseudodesulfovibrio]MCJ2163934.1 FAD-dependent oxidoreductase [Pseudodesulfovibrio sp. S3-i]RWU05821.1 NAD(P)/FAD-dependent oxidoreductase [Pseudodesulfovibrio sp. S3]
MNYVIVGNGVSAIGAIEGIRQHDKNGNIMVISDEAVPTYGRPLISYYLSDKIKFDTLPFRPKEFYEKNKVEIRLGSRVLSIDTKAKILTLDCGDTVSYDRLLLATGGTPVKPNLAGIDGPGVHNFTTVAHAEILKELVDKVKKVVVIGAGLIALKAAEGFAEKGVDTTIVVRSRIMRTYFDETAGELIVNHLEKNGIRFLQGTATKQIVRYEDGTIKGVETDKGMVAADVVIVAAGVRPNMGLAAQAGLVTEQGIRVNDYMVTSDNDIFAAGDVAEAKDLLTGEYTVRPIWPNAYTQGRYAGLNMAGANTPYTGGMSMNSITYYGLPTISVGETNLADDDEYETAVHLDRENSVYRKLIFKDNVLAGCILIGDIDVAGFYTSFIKNGFELDAKAKEQLMEGDPSPALWPDSFIEAMMNNP